MKINTYPCYEFDNQTLKYCRYEARKNPKVNLVGANPGSEERITIEGLRVSQAADTILYDTLVNDGLLSQVNAVMPKIYVGKRCSQHSFAQDDITR